MNSTETENTIAQAFTQYASQRMAKSFDEIAKCCAQLSEVQMHARGGEHENSVVNLLAHLEGNVRQWAIAGISGVPDVRERDAEFALDVRASGAEALARLQATVAEARTVIEGVRAERLMDVIDPQPTGIVRHQRVLEAIFRVASHLDHHTGQIILLTKQMVGRDLDLSMPRRRA